MLLEFKRSESDWFSKSELITHISALEDTHLFSYSCGGNSMERREIKRKVN